MPKEEYEAEEEEKEGDIYSDEGREELRDDDEIDPLEEGFMKGYEEGEKMAKCANCKKVLKGGDEVIELEIDNETYRFCSEECANQFQKRHRST